MTTLSNSEDVKQSPVIKSLHRWWLRHGYIRRYRYEWQKARADALSRELGQGIELTQRLAQQLPRTKANTDAHKNAKG